MTFLPGFLSGFGISANYTWTVSRAKPARPAGYARDKRSAEFCNVSPTYDRGRVSIRAGLSYNGPSIFAYQYQSGGSPDFGPHGPAGDQYLYTHFQVDAQAAFRVARGLQFIFPDEPEELVFGFYNGARNTSPGGNPTKRTTSSPALESNVREITFAAQARSFGQCRREPPPMAPHERGTSSLGGRS